MLPALNGDLPTAQADVLNSLTPSCEAAAQRFPCVTLEDKTALSRPCRLLQS